MSTRTQVRAFYDQDEARASAAELAADGYEVVVTNPTPSIYLKDETGTRTYWARDDDRSIYLVVASLDGLTPLN